MESDVNNRIKTVRMEKGLTQAQLAEASGVTRQTINLLENGRYNPTLKLCVAICRRLDRTLDELFWEDESNGIF